MNKNILYRSIPKVDILLENKTIQDLITHYSRDTVMEAIHIEMDKLRKFIGQCEEEDAAKGQIELLLAHIEMTVVAMHTPNMCTGPVREPSFTPTLGVPPLDMST